MSIADRITNHAIIDRDGDTITARSIGTTAEWDHPVSVTIEHEEGTALTIVLTPQQAHDLATALHNIAWSSEA